MKINPPPKEFHAWIAPEQKGPLKNVKAAVPPLKPHEVLIEVLACGVCHSDIHLIDDDWGITQYPLVPGHEIIGRVVAAGEHVPRHMHLGVVVGVGWQRAACGHCEDCVSGRDNMCSDAQATCVGHPGGFAEYHVSDWRYCFIMPEGLAAPEAAPLLCGGITVYSPLREFVKDGRERVGVVALGGLGHLAVKFASAMGCEVTLFSSSESKRAEAEAMGAKHFVSSTDADQIRALGKKFDLILVTAAVDLPWDAYLQTLRTDGTLCFVGVPPTALKLDIGLLLGKRRRIVASPIGSRFRIQEMLEFAARNGIRATSEVLPMSKVNEAVERVRANKARYRAVLVRD